MEEIIRKNAGLVSKVLNDLEVSEDIISSMAKIYALREDFKDMHFVLNSRGLWWEADISLKKRIDSSAEFKNYLIRNGISLEDCHIGGYGDEIFRPDHVLAINYMQGSQKELRCNFYNPGKAKHPRDFK